MSITISLSLQKLAPHVMSATDITTLIPRKLITCAKTIFYLYSTQISQCANINLIALYIPDNTQIYKSSLPLTQIVGQASDFLPKQSFLRNLASTNQCFMQSTYIYSLGKMINYTQTQYNRERAINDCVGDQCVVASTKLV